VLKRGPPSQGQGPGGLGVEQTVGTHAFRAGEARSPLAHRAPQRGSRAIATRAKVAPCAPRGHRKVRMARQGPRASVTPRRSCSAPAASCAVLPHQVSTKPVAVCRAAPEGWQRRWSTRAARRVLGRIDHGSSISNNWAELTALAFASGGGGHLAHPLLGAPFSSSIASSSFRSPRRTAPSRPSGPKIARRGPGRIVRQRLVGAPGHHRLRTEPVAAAQNDRQEGHTHGSAGHQQGVSPGRTSASDSASGPTM